MSIFDLRLVKRGGDGQPILATGNERGELLVAQGMPPYTEMTRKGQGWTVMTATAFTTVAAVPGTTAALEIFNNSQGSNSMNIVVADLFGFELLGTAATQTYSLWAMVTTQKVVPTLTALDMMSMSGKNKITTTAASPVVTGVGTTVIANGWRPWGPGVAWGTAAATPGFAFSAEVNGKLVVPPQCSLCVTVAGSLATASSFQAGASFYLESFTPATI